MPLVPAAPARVTDFQSAATGSRGDGLQIPSPADRCSPPLRGPRRRQGSGVSVSLLAGNKAGRSCEGVNHRNVPQYSRHEREVRAHEGHGRYGAGLLPGSLCHERSFEHPHDLRFGSAQNRSGIDDPPPDAAHPCASDDGGAAVANVRGVRPAYLPHGSRGQRRSVPLPARLPQHFRLDVHVVWVPGGVVPRRPRPSDRPCSPGGPGGGPPTGAARVRLRGLRRSERHGSRHPALRCARQRGPDPRLPPGQLCAGTRNSPGRDAGVHLAQHPKLCGEHRRTDHSRVQPGLVPDGLACGLACPSPTQIDGERP